MCHPYNKGLAVVLQQFPDMASTVEYADLFRRLEDLERETSTTLNWSAVRAAFKDLLADGGLVLGSDRKLRMTAAGAAAKAFAEDVAA
jgi:hypothetical protein